MPTTPASPLRHDETVLTVTGSPVRTYLAGQLGAIGCPVLLLSGEHDRLVPPADVRTAAARISHARFTLVAGTGHWLPRDAPRRGRRAHGPGTSPRRPLTVPPQTELVDLAAGANKAGNE